MKIPIFEPFHSIPKQTKVVMAIVEVVIALIIWQLCCGKHGLIPGPIIVAKLLCEVITEQGFVDNLFCSITLTIKSMFLSMLIALTLTYLSVIPVFRLITNFVIQCRYLTLTGLIFLFTLITQNGSQLKLSLLMFGIVPFFVTSLMSILAEINNQEYDLCKTLRFGNWETLYEVIILGQLDMVIEVIRQNFAISWLMITMVEGLSMSEGGLGVMLIKANKYLNLPKVFAILMIIFAMGVLFDILLRWVRRCLFPYSNLKVKH
jgi:ABC-type nitrate/sulfonate/bicarbonate transport system permease component